MHTTFVNTEMSQQRLDGLPCIVVCNVVISSLHILFTSASQDTLTRTISEHLQHGLAQTEMWQHEVDIRGSDEMYQQLLE